MLAVDRRALRLAPEEIEWSGTSVVLFGDARSLEQYVHRVRIGPGDPGERPHRHPGDEFGTVLEGVVWVAVDDRLSRADAKRLPTGSLIYIPPNLPHALWADEPALLQVHGVGPRGETVFLPSREENSRTPGDRH